MTIKYKHSFSGTRGEALGLLDWALKSLFNKKHWSFE